MNDTLLQMVASQIGIPTSVLAELKASKPTLIRAEFLDKDKRTPLTVLTVQITSPVNGFFPVVITLPTRELERWPFLHKQAVELAK